MLGNCLRHSQPVYIELPRDMAAQPCEAVTRAAPPEIDNDALDACVAEIFMRLQQARTPVLMAGVEVRRFDLEDKVAQLARCCHR